jgi:hypothetical protein
MMSRHKAGRNDFNGTETIWKNRKLNATNRADVGLTFIDVLIIAARFPESAPFVSARKGVDDMCFGNSLNEVIQSGTKCG